MARRLGDLAVTRAAFEAGELAEDQVRHLPPRPRLGRRRGRPLRPPRHPQPAQASLAKYCWTEPGPYDPDQAGPEPEAAARRRVGFAHGDDERWRLWGALLADEGALVEQGLVRARDELFRDRHPASDGDSPNADRNEVSWADALVHLGPGVAQLRRNQIEHQANARHPGRASR